MKKDTRKTAQKVRRLTMTALFAAMTCAATVVIQIPIPGNGYVNPGDIFVLLGAFILGFPYGVVAAGVGSALADLVTGYLYYVPGTFVIKSLMAVVGYGLFRSLQGRTGHKKLSVIAGAIAGEIVMVTGYFLYGRILLGGWGASALGIPPNLIQGAVGCIGSVVIYLLLHQKRFSGEKN